MVARNIEKVMTVFQGIGDRNPDLAAKYIHPTKYKEHNPFATDGINGMRHTSQVFRLKTIV